MTQINLKEFVCGGYFLTKYNEDAKTISNLLPNRILSASSCIVDLYPDQWLYELSKEKRLKREAENYGVSTEKLPQILDWTRKNLDSKSLGYPNVFHLVKKAQEFALFRDDAQEFSIIGIGLERNLIDEYFESEEEGFGVFESLKANKILEPDCEILGFEVLGNDYSHSHTWLCYGVIDECNKKFKVTPNKKGFIENFDEALRCAEYSIQEDIGNNGILWQPWLIVKYDV